MNRYYDPVTDEFMSIDPDVADTDQPYVFTNDNPLNAEDPLGLRSPETLTNEEQTLLDESSNGRQFNGTNKPLTPQQQKVWKAAKQKTITNEKVGQTRNIQKRQPGSQGGSAYLVPVTQSASMGPNQTSSTVTLRQFEGSGGNPAPNGGGSGYPSSTTVIEVTGGTGLVAFLASNPEIWLLFTL
jgi:hypothetical protein